MATMAPAVYGKLLRETLPSQIEDREQYDAYHERLSKLLRKGRERTPEETGLMRLLAVLIEDYDRRNALPPAESTPAERLQFLLEHSGKGPAHLTGVFKQRSHVNEALNGKRPISVEQARKLGKLFAVKPGLFV